MPLYRERLWAAPWIYLSTALVMPASLIVLAPISLTAGIITALVLYAGCVGIVLASSPLVVVTESELLAGRAHIGLEFVGQATSHEGDDAVAERGVRLDARAWLLIRGWVKPVVKVQILDASDPAPYWLLSSRSPEKLVAALENGRRGLEAPGD